MSKKNAIIFYAVLSALLILISPYLFMAFVFGVAGGANAISSGRTEGYALIFLGALPLYPVAFVLYGWYCIAAKKPLKLLQMLFSPVIIWIFLMLLFLFLGY